MSLIKRETCRVCGSKDLTKVIDLGEQYLQGSFFKPGKSNPPNKRFPTSLVLCNKSKNKSNCGLLQMEYTVSPEILYRTYWYRSGTNNTMREHLKGIANEANSILKKNNAIVLDIGCNDGTLLNFYPKEFKKTGIDPSNISKEAQTGFTIINDFFPSKKLDEVLKNNKFDIITSIAMFYDLESPIDFTKSIKRILSETGFWILELSYMPTMLELNAYDTICHEHLEYYSLEVLEYLFKKSNLKLFNVSFNSINGGSIRCYVTHEESSFYDKEEFLNNISTAHQNEKKFDLYLEKTYINFQEHINVHKKELISLLKNLKTEGKKIHIYGASTKGNTILQWCEIDNKIIDFAAERNPEKFGAFTLGTNIPIISEAESRAMKPDYYLVLPWHFREEFIEREKELINKGIGFIFPLPKIEVTKKEKVIKVY